jgi:adenine-specific DNA glycosylase
MAGAITSIAFNKPHPAVDGNVRRVLSRINGWTDDDPKRYAKPLQPCSFGRTSPCESGT